METVTPGSSGGHLSAPGGIRRRQHVEGTICSHFVVLQAEPRVRLEKGSWRASARAWLTGWAPIKRPFCNSTGGVDGLGHGSLSRGIIRETQPGTYKLLSSTSCSKWRPNKLCA